MGVTFSRLTAFLTRGRCERRMHSTWKGIAMDVMGSKEEDLWKRTDMEKFQGIDQGENKEGIERRTRL